MIKINKKSKEDKYEMSTDKVQMKRQKIISTNKIDSQFKIKDLIISKTIFNKITLKDFLKGATSTHSSSRISRIIDLVSKMFQTQYNKVI
jgi:hypothetical protein